MPEQIQITKINNGYLVAYPEPAKNVSFVDQRAIQAQQAKMCVHFCLDMDDIVTYLLNLNK
jgi:hypothetical protein